MAKKSREKKEQPGGKKQSKKTPEKQSHPKVPAKGKQSTALEHSSSSSISHSSLDSSPSTVLEEVTSSTVGPRHSKSSSAHHKTPVSPHKGAHHHHSPHATHVASKNLISNLHQNVVGSRIVDGKSKVVSGRSRVRNDPRADARPNENVPVEASADSIIDGTQSTVTLMDECLQPEILYNEDVRFEFQAKVMHCLSGTLCSPEKFLEKLSEGQDPDLSYLERHIDPQKLIGYMVGYMNSYYDLSKDSDPLSENRQKVSLS